MKDHKKSISAKLLAYVEYYLGSLCVSGAASYSGYYGNVVSPVSCRHSVGMPADPVISFVT